MDPVWVIFPRLLEPYGGVLLDVRKYVVHEVLQRGRLPLVGDVSEATVVLVCCGFAARLGHWSRNLNSKMSGWALLQGWRRLSLGFTCH